jgi:hypothetical protein
MLSEVRFLLACSSAILIAGCGPTDTTPMDAGPDTTPPDSAVDTSVAPPGETFWVSSDGDDAADGSEAAPWATFSHAIAQLSPGDTLLVKAGSVFGRLGYDCQNLACDGEPCPSGEPGRPITVRAEEPRTVELSNLQEALTVRGCSHVVIDGFEAHQRDEESDSFSWMVFIHQSDHVVVRNSIFHTLNRWVNGHIIALSESRHVLFEDSELYDYHRGGVIVRASEHVTIRRIYINGRDTPDLPAPAYSCCCVEGADYGIRVHGSFDVTVENSIVERTCAPFHVQGTLDDPIEARPNSATRFLGSVALSSRNSGFVGSSYCEAADPCAEDNRVVDVEVVDCVSIDSHDGFNMDGVARALLRNVTAIDSRDDDFDIGVGTDNAAVDDASFIVLNALDTGTGGTAYEISGQAEGLVATSNSFGNDSVFDPMFTADAHGTVDPQLGGCLVYVPDGSPMRAAGGGGADIGARIVNRYVDGTLTDEPLWDPTTGAFPCGAIVEGVNDEATHPGATCSTVHERLHVGAEGCALP